MKSLDGPLLRRGLLFGTLALSLAAAWWVGEQERQQENGLEVAEPETPAQKRRLPLAEPAPAPAPGAGPVDIFAVRTWEPPPPPPDLNPPPPQAPPLPYRFMGRINEPGQKPAFMLAEGERTLVVSVGDAVGADYRLEKFEQGQLIFLYRPLQIRQALDVGSEP